jgi:peptide/nickel transport system permease protein
MATASSTTTVRAPRIMVAHQSYGREVARRLLRKPLAIAGLALLLVMMASAILAPLLAPHEPDAQGAGDPFVPPSRANPFGTDQFGRDVFTRVLYGGRISLQIGLVAVAIGGTLGLVLGCAAGYISGWADEAVMRFIDIMLAFPGILLAIAVVIMLGPSLYNLMIAVGIGAVPTFARVVRASVLDVKERDFIAAARVVGAVDLMIIARHILPNIMAPFIILATLDVATAILSGTALSYLGMGAKPPTPEWGLMLSEGRTSIRTAWWVGTFPGLAITITVIGINLLGDALRDALDPRLRGTR